MNEVANAGDPISLLDLLVGLLVVSAVLLKTALARFGIPALVSYLLLGVALRVIDHNWDLVSDDGEHVLEFLASLGVIALLFRVGLESNLHGLLDKLPRAAPIWIGNVVLSAVAGYVAARHLLSLPIVPSLFAATAFTATSVAVSLEPWRDAGILRGSDGELLTDVAGLDDVSAIVLMALLLAVMPALNSGIHTPVASLLAQATLVVALKAVVLGALCLVLGYFVQRHLRRLMRALSPPDPILMIGGIGIVIASLASALGFSLAVGALFAGLVFSRNSEVVRMETMFEPVADFFTPFFFIGIGIGIDVAALPPALAGGMLLLAFAVAAKVLGAGLPARLSTGWMMATAIGVSMVPRAEIAMVVMHEGQRLGAWAVPPELYGAMVFVSAATCIAAPIVVRALLRGRGIDEA